MLDDGKINDIGTHGELLARNQIYQRSILSRKFNSNGGQYQSGRRARRPDAPPVSKAKNAKHTLGRVLQYLGRQRWVLLFVFFCVIISAGASVAGTYFLKPLINEYILPLIGTSPSAADFLPLAKALIVLACIYLAGVACTYLQMRLMISVAQTTLTDIRRDLFNHMQDLPISFFDSHTHGELMSRYTNDVDTLREALSNSVVQMLSSGITVVGTFVMMLVLRH